jgi:hypothetical protein
MDLLDARELGDGLGKLYAGGPGTTKPAVGRACCGATEMLYIGP